VVQEKARSALNLVVRTATSERCKHHAKGARLGVMSD